MATLEEFKLETEADNDFQSLFKKFRETEISAFNYEGEFSQMKHAILRYVEEAEAHLNSMISANNEIENIVDGYKNKPHGKAFIQPIESIADDLYDFSSESIKACLRGLMLSLELLMHAEHAVILGYQKGWENYVDEQIVAEFKELKERIQNLESKLGKRVKE